MVNILKKQKVLYDSFGINNCQKYYICNIRNYSLNPETDLLTMEKPNEFSIDKVYKIALSLIPGVGISTSKTLLAYVGSVEGIFKARKSSLQKIPGIGEVTAENIAKNDVMKRAEAEVNFIEKHGINLYFFHDKDYPTRLKECPDNPVLIFSKGNCDFNSPYILAIVGTRNASDYGKNLTRQIVTDLHAKFPDLIFVSGLAYGIDIEAHRVAIECGAPTIAAMGTGLHTIYPSANRNVASKIINNGALITEFMSGVGPDRQNFVRRNRIVAGMCDATIVIESALKGGALITAELAHSYHRDVMAVPGDAGKTWSAGCNDFIKRNIAALVENADDICSQMNWYPIQSKNDVCQRQLLFDLTPDEEKLIGLLRENGNQMHLNSLALACGISIGEVSLIILSLELKGVLKNMAGNLIFLV